MIVIKNKKNFTAAIVGEMLNVESGLKLFSNGKFKPTSTEYPKAIVGNREITIKASCGVILLPDNICTSEYKCTLVSKIVEMQTLIPQMILNNYQSVSYGLHTRRKIVSKRQFTTTDTIATRNTRRIITDAEIVNDKNSTRFIWRICTLSSKSCYMINNHCDIFILYDAYDICKYSNEEFTLQSSILYACAPSNMTDLSIILIKDTDNPLLPSLRETPCRNMLHGAYFNTLLEKPYEYFNYTSAEQYCYSCNTPLYHDNYIFTVNRKYYNTCPVCVHIGKAHLVTKCDAAYRVRFPKTIEVRIEEMRYTLGSPELIDLYYAVYRNITYGHLAEYNVYYTVFGDKYIAFEDNDVIYSPAVKDEFVKKYKIVTLTYV